jgi:hypothetical protein
MMVGKVDMVRTGWGEGDRGPPLVLKGQNSRIGMTSAIALLLIALGVMTRFLPHPHGAVAIGALAIYTGARLPRWWGLAVPIGALLVSDVLKVFLVWGIEYAGTLWSLESVVRYVTFAVIVLVSGMCRTRRAAGLVALSLGASTLFFLTTNFMVWAIPRELPGEPLRYARDLGGLLHCYTMGLPFFRNSLIADLLGTTVLFGLDALACAWGARARGKLAPQTVRSE